MVNDENFLTVISSDDAQEPAADKVTALLDGMVQKHCRILHCPFQGLLDHLAQGSSDLEMKIDLILSLIDPTLCVMSSDVRQ